MEIQVKKRNGRLEKFSAEKINKTAERACNQIEDVSASELVLDAKIKLYDKVTTESIDKALIEAACAKIPKDPNWSYVAARLSLDCIYKEVFKESTTAESFTLDYRAGFIKNIKKLVKDGYFDPRLLEFDLKKISEAIQPSRDYKFSYMGVKNLQQKYLFKNNGKILESPQAFWMRVAMGLSLNEKNKEDFAIELYNTYSQFFACSSTPNLFNSGTLHSQTASCFLSTISDDANSIGFTIWQNARMSKYAGGLGIDLTSLRATGSHIKSTNGVSSGPIPFAKMVEAMIISFNQSGKRAGSAAIYMEPWHLDFPSFLELKKVTGDEWQRTHKLNTAAWYPDEFFFRLQKKQDWYFFDPKETPDLHEIYGLEFSKRYSYYVEQAEKGSIRFDKKRAIDLWQDHLKMLFETGHPWITFKDSANIRYSDQQEGIIHNSNLCVAPETLLLTKTGYWKISDLVNREVEVWNGKQWSKTTVVKTGESQKLITFIIEVTDSWGDKYLKELSTTEYHKFYLKDGQEVRASDLKKGDYLLEWAIDEYRTTNILVKHIVQTNRFDDTYCVNEPLEHKVVFEEILTGNCTEVFRHNKPTVLSELGDIIEHGETAVCQLGSINGKYHVKNGEIDWNQLEKTVKTMIRCIDNAIDINFYPTHETKAHLKHRPIGLGFMGMQDVCYSLGIRYDSEAGVELSSKIQEFISYHSILTSSELAKERGAYPTYEGSTWSRGVFPQDTFCELMKYRGKEKNISSLEKMDWSVVRQHVKEFGMRNSNTMAIAPTAGISYLQNCEQSIEPSFESIAVYNNDSGTNYNINAFQFLKEALKREGKWNSRVGPQLLSLGGNIKNFDCSQETKDIYCSCWDRDMIMLIKAAAARQIWIDQGQSLNLYFDRSDIKELSKYYKSAWEEGLKSTYYLRNKKATSVKKIEEVKEVPEEFYGKTCSMEEGCLSCQ